MVSYCLKLETLVQDLIDLAESGKEELKYDVYGSSVRTSIQNLFSLKEIKKLRSLTGRGKVGLEEHVQFVKDLRMKAQSMVDPGEMKEKFSRRGESGSSTGDSRIKSSHNLFKKPRKFDECSQRVSLSSLKHTIEIIGLWPFQ